MAVAGMAMFFAVFSLLSYRMYVGLDPSLGNQSQAQTTASSSVAEEAAVEADESAPIPSNPQPTTRAS